MTDNEAGSRRLDEFEAEVAGLRLRGGSIERERFGMKVGVTLVVLGVGIGLFALLVSGVATDPRDVTTLVSLSVLGLSISVVGALVWLRYSLTHYLRYWLLRLVYEERNRSSS